MAHSGAKQVPGSTLHLSMSGIEASTNCDGAPHIQFADPANKLEVASAVVVLAVVAVVDHEVAWWNWSVGVAGVVQCKLPVEVSCGDGVALAGLVVAKLEVSAVPREVCGGCKDGVGAEVRNELGWVWMLWCGFGGVGEGLVFADPPPNASPLDKDCCLLDPGY